MTTSSEPFNYDASEQDQRVWAMLWAKRVLTRKPFGGDEIDTVDLISLATFILTGDDPYAVVQDPSVPIQDRVV